jgi:hypothetical protein
MIGMDGTRQVCTLNDLETEAQLAAILYRATPAGKTEIESKEDARKRGQSSPDRAEALVMAFGRVVPREQTVIIGERVVISQFRTSEGVAEVHDVSRIARDLSVVRPQHI